MALFRLYFVQSLCALLCLFLERNNFLIGNVDIYAGFIGEHPPLHVPQGPFQEGWQPPRGIPYNDTYYLDLLKSEWCPGIGSCKSPNVMSNDTGCALPCSCSEDCWNIGNCCYDKQYSDSEVIMSREICDFTRIAGTKPGSNLRKADDLYMFIDSCDADFEGIEIFKCMNPNLQNLNDLTPVYDPVSGHNYKNMFCAICSYVTTPVVRWLPKLTYYKDQPNLINILQNKEDIHLPLGVSVIWIPQNINFTTCVKQSDVMSECHTTLATNLSTNLCQSITMPVKFGAFIYKNMYCILCSTYILPNYTEGQVSTYGARSSFAMFLNYDSRATHIDATSKPPAKCSPDLTYIGDLGECLKIYCGSSIMKIKGHCLPVMDNISGVSLHFRIKILFLASLYSKTTLEGIKDLTTSLIDSNELKLWKCFEINTELGQHIDKHIVFDIKVAVELGKHNLSIQNYYTAFINKLNLTKVDPSRSSLQEFGIIDVLQGDYGYNILESEYVNFASFAEETGLCGYGIAMTNLQFCNSVRIKPYEIADNHQINVTFSGNNVTFNWSEYLIRYDVDGFVAQICLDTYLGRTSPYVIHQPSSVSSFRATCIRALVIILFGHLASSLHMLEVCS